MEEVWTDSFVQMEYEGAMVAPTVNVVRPMPHQRCNSLPDDIRFRSFSASDVCIERVGERGDFVAQKRRRIDQFGTQLRGIAKDAEDIAKCQYDCYLWMKGKHPAAIRERFALNRRLHVVPSIACYHLYIKGLANAGLHQEILDVLDDMAVDHVEPRLSTFRVLVNELCPAGMSHFAARAMLDDKTIEFPSDMWETVLRGMIADQNSSMTRDFCSLMKNVVSKFEHSGGQLSQAMRITFCQILVNSTDEITFLKEVFSAIGSVGNDTTSQATQLMNSILTKLTTVEDEGAPTFGCNVATFAAANNLKLEAASYVSLLMLCERARDPKAFGFFHAMRTQNICSADALLVVARMCRNPDLSAEAEKIFKLPRGQYILRYFETNAKQLRESGPSVATLEELFQQTMICAESDHDLPAAVDVLQLASSVLDTKTDLRGLVGALVRCCSWHDEKNTFAKLYPTNWDTVLARTSQRAVALNLPLIKGFLARTAPLAAVKDICERLEKQPLLRLAGRHPKLGPPITSDLIGKLTNANGDFYVSLVDDSAIASFRSEEGTSAAITAMMKRYESGSGAAMLLGMNSLVDLHETGCPEDLEFVVNWLSINSKWFSIVPISYFVHAALWRASCDGANFKQHIKNWVCLWMTLMQQEGGHNKVALLTNSKPTSTYAAEECQLRPVILVTELMSRMKRK